MKGEKGQALIELALSIVLLLVVLFGITEFGRYFFQRNTLNNAARAGVREAVVTPDLDKNDTDIVSYVQDDVLDDTGVVVCVCIGLGAGVVCITSTVPPVCTGAGLDSASAGDRITVGVGDTFTIVTGTIVPFFSGDRVIAGEASMRYE